ncbi:MAG: hypothetical protein A2Y73_00760, partial [Chloroflexi bacterium RBG_13_56_8]
MSSKIVLLEETSPWKFLGPIANGGTVFGLAISPVADVPRYWAATGCGVFSSDDEGATWAQTLSGLTTPLLSSLAVALNGALFAGSLEGDLFRSFDFGSTWEVGTLPSEHKATVIALFPSPNFRADGAVFAATDGEGLLVSRDSGRNWEDSSFGLGDPAVLAVAGSSDWSRQEIMFAATTEGVFVSRNGGRAWRKAGLMLEDDIVDVLAVSPAYAQDQTLFAGTEGGSLYRSEDGGITWGLLQEQLGEGPINCLWLSSNFAESGRTVVAVGTAIHVSDDRGESWHVGQVMPHSVLALTGDQNVVLAGLHDAGVWKSLDGGATWASFDGFTARGFERLLVAEDRLFAIGPQEGVYVSGDGGVTWRNLLGLDVYTSFTSLAVGDQQTLLVASQEQGLVRSADGGLTWGLVEQTVGVQAVLLLPNGGEGLAGTVSGQLLATHDAGKTWQEVESPCEGQEILSLVASPNYTEDHALLMGTRIPSEGKRQSRISVWASKDSGASWKQITVQNTPARWIHIAIPLGVAEDAADQAVLA